MASSLVSWIGLADLSASEGTLETGQLGPIASALEQLEFDQVFLIHDQSAAKAKIFEGWLKKHTDRPLYLHRVKLSSPTHFSDIHKAFDEFLSSKVIPASKGRLMFHLSPGTPAMAAVSILLGKTKYSAGFLQSSPQSGTTEVDVPFDIAAEFLPAYQASSDSKLKALAYSDTPISAAFDNIITQSPVMKRLLHKAEKIAIRDVPVLIMGESGTGKELFAKAIHSASARQQKPMVVVNCGAIAPELLDSELFGHAKGAFTGANSAKVGYFEAADGGTIFLDEFGELSLAAQVRLLRVLQSGEYNRVGETTSRHVDVRVIAATNRPQIEGIEQGKFREDLFYRVAVGVLNLPPLRERKGDVGLLAERLLEQVNQEASSQPGYIHKKLSPKAKNIILKHRWPGNVRELYATLVRASIWASGQTIDDLDVKESLLEAAAQKESIIGHEFDKSFKIESLIDDLKRHYIEKALSEAAGSKSKAAELLGLNSYQVLSNWMKNLEMDH